MKCNNFDALNTLEESIIFKTHNKSKSFIKYN